MLKSVFTQQILKNFSTMIKLNQKQFLSLATKQINKLTELAEQKQQNSNMDINSTDYILKINYKNHSIVINTQTPNRQLWYSCTKSGPQRFDYVKTKQDNQIWENNKGISINQQLKNDIQDILI